MKVRDVMLETPAYCENDMDLGRVVELFWTFNCGFLPVVDSDMKVTGVITDRDVCIALGTRTRVAGEITVREVNSEKVYSCKPADDIHDALATMSAHKVRRLPVVDAQGKLQAILSMDDILLHIRAQKAAGPLELSPEEVVDTLRSVCAPYLPVVTHTKFAVA